MYAWRDNLGIKGPSPSSCMPIHSPSFNHIHIHDAVTTVNCSPAMFLELVLIHLTTVDYGPAFISKLVKSMRLLSYSDHCVNWVGR